MVLCHSRDSFPHRSAVAIAPATTTTPAPLWVPLSSKYPTKSGISYGMVRVPIHEPAWINLCVVTPSFMVDKSRLFRPRSQDEHLRWSLRRHHFLNLGQCRIDGSVAVLQLLARNERTC